MDITTDILIVGAGSAGFGAAYRVLKHSRLSVVLIDSNPGPGGTSTYGGVNCWEPGYGGNGVHSVLAEMLISTGEGFVGEGYGDVTDQTPWGCSGPSQSLYIDTLERAHRQSKDFRRFHFEPDAMARCMLELLNAEAQDNQVEFLFSSKVVSVEVENDEIMSVCVDTPNGETHVKPRIVLDCTGNIEVARKAGCSYSVGEDSFMLYKEPHAPEYPQRNINGMSLLFRVTPCNEDYFDEIPTEYDDVDLEQWLDNLERTNRPLSCFNEYPNGDINVNMLPTLPGECFLNMEMERIMHICKARVYAYWNWVQTKRNFRGYRIKEIFPMLGIRESYRLTGKYVLKEQDLILGYASELSDARSIAYADHPADIHGKSNKSGGMTTFGKYGIPYESILPKEIDNLLVACRGSSFSHIAASSARLSRTMISLGEAAGIAAVDCLERKVSLENVDVARIRLIMGIE